MRLLKVGAGGDDVVRNPLDSRFRGNDGAEIGNGGAEVGNGGAEIWNGGAIIVRFSISINAP